MDELSSGRGRRRWWPLLFVSLLLAVAAASLSAAAREEDVSPPAVEGTADGLETPSTPDVVPSPAPPRPLLVSARPDLPDGFEVALAALPDVRAVYASHREIVHLRDAQSPVGGRLVDLEPGWVVPLQATTVDPAFPGLPPALAALQPGTAVMAASSADRHGIEPGASIDLDGVTFEVAAVVPDAVTGPSEVVLAAADGIRMQLGRRSLTVVHDGDEGALEKRIRSLFPADVDGRVRALDEDPRLIRPRSRSLPEMKERFGEFAHGPIGPDGRFTQDREWRAANIVTERVPVLGAITCHREFIPLVAAALGELEELGLADLVDPSDYGGCWASRLVGGSTSISKHAWGAAIDLNVSANGRGQEPTLDRRVIVVFEKWGMRWGGDFPTPDGMHFEWSFDARR